jgi:hypothetical protein
MKVVGYIRPLRLMTKVGYIRPLRIKGEESGSESKAEDRVS